MTGGVDPGHKVLSGAEKQEMQAVKNSGETFMELLDFLETENPTLEIAQAKFRLQEAIMWAVKHVTK